MKILSSKKYKGLVNQNNKLTTQILKQIHEINEFKDKLNANETQLYIIKSEMTKLELENRRLKAILKKNKIDYKKESVGKWKKKK